MNKDLEKLLDQTLTTLDKALETTDKALRNIEKELDRLHGVMIAMTAALILASFGPAAEEVVKDLNQAAKKALKGTLTREEAREVLTKVANGLDKLEELQD